MDIKPNYSDGIIRTQLRCEESYSTPLASTPSLSKEVFVLHPHQ
jgi:hypothetical protein